MELWEVSRHLEAELLQKEASRPPLSSSCNVSLAAGEQISHLCSKLGRIGIWT